MLPSPALLGLAIAIALLVLLPARRLHLAGMSSRVIALYATALWALGMFVAIRPVLLKVLVPILAPFVTAPDRVAGIVRRTRRRDDDLPRPPMKNVTPPDGPPGAP